MLISKLLCGIYGIAFASFGVIFNLPAILLYQIFGPISDVTLGIIHISKLNMRQEKIINKLDVSGNTMSAVVKGFSTGSAGLVSFGLFGAIMISSNVHINYLLL